jgi:hypothetical protein
MSRKFKDDRQLDIETWIEALRLRDEGIEATLRKEDKRGEWRRKATEIVVATFPMDWIGLAEEFQAPVVAKIGAPHVPQVWGGLTSSLIKAGWFMHTGDHDQCRKLSSHGCDGKTLRKLA